MSTSYDAIVIGSGQAAPSLAVRLAEAGMKTVLVEREHLGGTCVNDGCIPTKTLVASARTAHVARRAADYGVNVGPVSVDMKAVKARKDAVVQQSIDGLSKWIAGTKNLSLVWGHARFTAPHAIEVNGETLEAPKIFLNVGARPVLPSWKGIADVPVLNNTSMMAVDTLPEHLLIVGGSYIGLEFAQMYRRFGSRVTVLEFGDRLIGREDPEVSAEIQRILEREGVVFHFSVKDAAVAKGANGSGIRIVVEPAGKALAIEGSHLLAAVGRRANTDDLGLDKAGIAVDARGYITVDDELRTSVPGVWALGDANGRGAFTHTSYNDFQIVAGNLLDGAKRRVSDRLTTYALFIDPPLGRVGMSEAEVRARGKPALVGVMPMTRVGRARERGETQGFMKVLVDAETERILGASLLCIDGDEIVHMLLAAMAGDLSYKIIEKAVHIHPTVSELIPTLLEGLKPLAPAGPDSAMPDRREELERITALTLGHYDASAEAFWVGTRDHDVRQNIEALLRHLEGTGPFAILDLGCGPGRDLVTFRDLGHEAIGVDGAARFVEMARDQSGCEVWQQNLLALALPEARFDGIFANAVLQHVPASELPRVLLELRTALRPHGVLFSSIPRGQGEEGWNNGRYSVYHEPAAWQRHGAEAGFVELEHYYRPEGRPREQQPWLASVWRRGDDPPR